MILHNCMKMKNKTLLLFFLLFQFSFSQNVKLKTGDILFQSMNCGPLCEAINEVTEGYQGKDFSHLGMVYIKNDSIFVIEAAGKAVKVTPYETFKTYTNEEMFVGRLKNKYHKYIPEAITFSLQQVGIPYDDEYLYDNGKYYCSEFIYKILSDDSVKLFGKTKKIVKPMDFEKIENLKFVYEGKIIDYKLKKISTLNLFDKVI